MEQVRIYKLTEGFLVPTTQHNVVLMKNPYFRHIPEYLTSDPSSNKNKDISSYDSAYSVLMDASNILDSNGMFKNLHDKWFTYKHPEKTFKTITASNKKTFDYNPIPIDTKVGISAIHIIKYMELPLGVHLDKKIDIKDKYFPTIISTDIITFSEYEKFVENANRIRQDAIKRLEKFNLIAGAKKALFEMEQKEKLDSEIKKELENMPSLEELLKEKKKIKLFD